jgi:phospho-N-acetylmuramoyl-pentapeptide-transferase
MPEITINVIKVFTVGFFSFLLAFLITPTMTHFLYKHKLWKKESKKKSIDGKNVDYFERFHSEEETKIPRLGGLLIWLSVVFLSFLFLILSKFSDLYWVQKINFLSRDQTWLPLFTLVAASLVGLIDDLLQVLDGIKEKYIKKGLSLRYRILLVSLIGMIGAWWFYFRLGQDFIYIPIVGEVYLGLFYLPFFVIVMIAIYSGGVIDGIDGLSAGTFVSIFTAYTAIALFQGQINLATFCIAIVGSILAFLWFNIPPARFYMGETGVIGLTATITVVAFLTNGVFVLPIIAFLLVITSASVIIQLLAKKLFNKKVFLAAPLHHHFEALGWPHYKVTMRFWIVGVIAAILGVVIHLLG